MVLDWSGLTVRMGNMMIDAKKAIEEKLQNQITLLGIIAVAFIGIGIYYVIRRK